MLTEEAIDALLQAARAGSVPVTLYSNDTRRHVYLPVGGGGAGEMRIIDQEAGAATPYRKRGTVLVFDAASFNRIIADNSDAGNAVIYIDRDPAKPAISAVLNGHSDEGPGWGDFRVHLTPRPTPQWTKWRGIDGKMLPQAEFAEFIEDNLADIVDPPGAQALEIASHLEATRSASFKSAIRLNSGAVQLQNLEDLDAKVGPGRIEVPTLFKLALAPFQGIPAYAVEARFRYRIADGRLLLGLKLQRIEDVMRAVLDDIVGQIDAPSAAIVEGIPPEPTK